MLKGELLEAIGRIIGRAASANGGQCKIHHSPGESYFD